MNVNASWIHEGLVAKTVSDFATLALPDSVLARWPEDGPAYPLSYEVADAVPLSFGSRAFHIDVFLEMTDPRQPDAHVFFTVNDDSDGAWAGRRQRAPRGIPRPPWRDHAVVVGGTHVDASRGRGVWEEAGPLS